MSRVGWHTICQPKRFWGLGVVDLRLRNMALLAKWAWQYALEPDSLWRRLIVAKYGAQVLAWMGIFSVKELLHLMHSFGLTEDVMGAFRVWMWKSRRRFSVFSGFYRQWWLSSCVVVLWSLWLARNRAFFEGKVMTVEELFFLVKLRSFYWVKVAFVDLVIEESTWWSCPLDCSFPVLGRVCRVGVSWIPQVVGAVKFNVDGAARGKSGPAGCGGVLRDSGGRILACFSGPLGSLDSNEAKLRAIDFALDFLVSSRWRYGASIIIESDSVTAISWILHQERRP
ncbi:hypothetical protein GQ457_07G009460 [Hibiscus cannabinus]